MSSAATTLAPPKRLEVLFEELAELAGQRNAIDGRIVDVIAQIDHHGLWGNTGCGSLPALVACKTGTSLRSRLWRGPATYPSADIDMERFVVLTQVLTPTGGGSHRGLAKGSALARYRDQVDERRARCAMTTLTAAYLDAGEVVLRKARDDDRGSIIEHVTDPEVRAHLGGPQPRAAVARDLDEAGVTAATDSAGSYVIATRATDAFIGTVSLTRRGVHHPGHLTPSGEELELAYTLDPSFWGRGLAYRATTAVLCAAAVELPDEPVIVVTQSANIRSLKLARRLGFLPATTFEEFGEQHTLAVARLHDFLLTRAT